MGWTDFEDEPLDPSDLSIEAQQALLLMNILPDKIEGMNGIWLGKDYTGLSDIMNIYNMINWRDTFDLFQVCIIEFGKFYEEKRKQEEAKSKNRAKFSR